jgi:hypothetical protein
MMGLSSFCGLESSEIREYVQGHNFVADLVDHDHLGTLQFSLVPIGSGLVDPVELSGRKVQSQSALGQKISSKDHSFIQI